MNLTSSYYYATQNHIYYSMVKLHCASLYPALLWTYISHI